MISTRFALLAMVCVASTVMLASLTAHGQESQDNVNGYCTVNIERQFEREPVKIVGLRLGDISVQPNTPFLAQTDCLEKLSIVLKNKTHKKITAAVIHLDFPDTESAEHPRMGHQVQLGPWPEHALYTRNGRRVHQKPTGPFALLPGQEAIVPLSPEYGAIKAFIETRQPMRTIKVCWVRLQLFYFDDGTRWALSNYERPDLEHPGRYIPITLDDFRGEVASH